MRARTLAWSACCEEFSWTCPNDLTDDPENMSSVNRTEMIAVEATSKRLETNAYMNTHKRTRTCTHDAGRQVAPLVLLSIHPSYHRTEHMSTRTHAHIDTDSEDRGGSDTGKCNEEYRDRGR